jgi:hypothetical protein
MVVMLPRQTVEDQRAADVVLPSEAEKGGEHEREEQKSTAHKPEWPRLKVNKREA